MQNLIALQCHYCPIVTREQRPRLKWSAGECMVHHSSAHVDCRSLDMQKCMRMTAASRTAMRRRGYMLGQAGMLTSGQMSSWVASQYWLFGQEIGCRGGRVLDSPSSWFPDTRRASRSFHLTAWTRRCLLHAFRASTVSWNKRTRLMHRCVATKLKEEGGGPLTSDLESIGDRFRRRL
jgi:hypothetical protein